MIYFMGKMDYWTMQADIRVNTVNCVGVMGKGIALDFKNRYPEMFRDYQRQCRMNLYKPGGIHEFIYPANSQPTPVALAIWNAATKLHWKDPSTYEWVERIIVEMRRRLEAIDRPMRITIPALGCGNGGLCWNSVATSLYRGLGNLNHSIHIFNPKDGAAFDMVIQ